MSVGNIVDHRTNSFRVECDVVIEPSCHDNCVHGATQFQLGKKKQITVDYLGNTTIADAIAHCKQYPYPVTLYVYDKDSKPIGR